MNTIGRALVTCEKNCHRSKVSQVVASVGELCYVVLYIRWRSPPLGQQDEPHQAMARQRIRPSIRWYWPPLGNSGPTMDVLWGQHEGLKFFRLQDVPTVVWRHCYRCHFLTFIVKSRAVGTKIFYFVVNNNNIMFFIMSVSLVVKIVWTISIHVNCCKQVRYDNFCFGTSKIFRNTLFLLIKALAFVRATLISYCMC